jgi:DNA-directed RNA polymerase specialized sigma24 family protein
VDAAERRKILSRYVSHSRRFDEVAAKRGQGNAEVIPFAPLRRSSSRSRPPRDRGAPADLGGLVNREIGQRLFLSEETVKSHVRHLLAKLQARSRAHAVAVGFRRGLIA